MKSTCFIISVCVFGGLLSVGCRTTPPLRQEADAPGSGQAATWKADYGARCLVEDAGYKSSWSPDGQRLVYGLPNNQGIAILNRKTSQSTPLVENGKDPAWSPNGRYIAYVTEPGQSYVSEQIWIVPAGGGRPVKIGNGGFPSWSADSQRVIFHTREQNKVMDVDIGDPQKEAKLFFESPISWYPAVTLDERRIAFGAQDEVGIMDRKSQTVTVIRTPGQRGMLPAWSADGRLLAFGGFNDSNYGLWVFDRVTGNLVQAVPGNYTMPAWSPDGRWLAFEFRGAPRNQLWVIETKNLLKKLGAGSSR